MLIENYNLKDKKHSLSNKRINYDKEIKEKLQSRNSCKNSFNNAGVSTSFDKLSVFNDSRTNSKYPLQVAYSFTTNNHNQTKFKHYTKPLNTEFKRIEEKPNETSLIQYDDIFPSNESRNSQFKINNSNILLFERKCEVLFKKVHSIKDSVHTSSV